MTTTDVVLEIRRACRKTGVTTSDRLNLSDRQRQAAIRKGLLARGPRGVLLDPSYPNSPRKQLAAATSAGRPYAAGWGRSCMAMWALLDEHPTMPEVVVPEQRYARIPGAVVHRSSSLSPDDVTWRHGIPVLKPLVAMLSIGAVLPPMEVAELMVRARQKKLFDPTAVEATLARQARSGSDGIRVCRDALELVMIGDRPADSVLELRFHHGPGRLLPPYEYQYEVKIDGKTYRPDFAYPDVKVAIEVDGYEKRKDMESLIRDTRKTRALAKAGWTVPHAAWHDVVHDPYGVACDVLEILRACGYPFGR
jgi:very-short-patch-repair endonuclease